MLNEYLKKASQNVEDGDFEFKPEELVTNSRLFYWQIAKRRRVKRFWEINSVWFKQNKIRDYITEQVLKTIVAFLNTDGGTLVVGQSDDKKLVIEADKFKSQDDCSKYLKDKKNKNWN